MRSTTAESITARLPNAGLIALYAFTAVALLGYATFGLHPMLLARFPEVARFYGIAFQFFAQAQIYIAFAVLAGVLALYAGTRWIAAFGALYLLSLGSELLGTGVGIPFGEYHYTEALGPRWFGHVPVVIPLSWFFMALPSYAAARAALPDRPVARVLVASFILLSWDLALDPAMSHATAYWVWGQPGAYYGMPWLNLFGWYVTGLVLMATLAAMKADGWLAAVPLRWMLAFYGANLLLPIGMSAAAGLWGAVAATLGALAGAALLARALARRGEARTAMVGVPA
jgi:putative membrane protein